MFHLFPVDIPYLPILQVVIIILFYYPRYLYLFHASLLVQVLRRNLYKSGSATIRA